MTVDEFSNTFDTLLNSHSIKANFGEGDSKVDIVLDEYEKSVLLTQAQDIILKSYFDERSNQTGQGFDGVERRQVDFSSLITVAEVTPSDNVSNTHFADDSYLFALPTQEVTIDGSTTVVSKVLFIINERVKLTKAQSPTKNYVVVPINYREYDRKMSKPFAQPLKKQCWRLLQDNNAATSNGTLYAEIVLTDAAKSLIAGEYSAKYVIRYVRRPRPIVLTNLENSGTSVDGVTAKTECELNPILHMDILNKAVEIALSTHTPKVAPQTQQQRTQ